MHFSSGITPLSTAARAGSGGGGDAYVASAVAGAEAYLETSSLIALDSGLLHWSIWVKRTNVVNNPVHLWRLDYDGNDNAKNVIGNSDTFLFDSFPPSFDGEAQFSKPDATHTDTWDHILVSIDTNQSGAAKVVSAYVNDVQLSPEGALNSTGSAFILGLNGKQFSVLGISGAPPDAEYADFRFATGVALHDGTGAIPEATRRLFIDADGKPVDPVVATAELGAPCILFSGDAASFATNQGTGGAFTLTGSLTNASTSPSD